MADIDIPAVDLRPGDILVGDSGNHASVYWGYRILFYAWFRVRGDRVRIPLPGRGY